MKWLAWTLWLLADPALEARIRAIAEEAVREAFERERRTRSQ